MLPSATSNEFFFMRLLSLSADISHNIRVFMLLKYEISRFNVHKHRQLLKNKTLNNEARIALFQLRFCFTAFCFSSITIMSTI